MQTSSKTFRPNQDFWSKGMKYKYVLWELHIVRLFGGIVQYRALERGFNKGAPNLPPDILKNLSFLLNGSGSFALFERSNPWSWSQALVFAIMQKRYMDAGS